MKFGQQLRTSLIRDYQYYYLNYDELKNELKTRQRANDGQGPPKPWDDEDEKVFYAMLEAELDKVFTFQKVKAGEIIRRIQISKREVEGVIALLNQEGESSGGQQPTEDDFEMLEADLSDIIADVHDLAKFTQLNYTGFQKILKKHDKQTGRNLRVAFSTRLNKKPFFKDNYDALIVKLSELYNEVRTKGKPIQGDSSAGGSQQNFIRNTTKYWVHPDNITELKLIILKHLPVLVFNPNKEFDPADSAISSIYYDNRDFELYLGRLQKTEGAEAIRLRWYGGMGVEQIFVERKTHREDWTGEKSVKARFQLKEKNVNAFLKGEYTVEQAFEKMRKDGKKSPAEIENLEALAREIQYTTITKELEPAVRSFYNRTAFQLPGDARVRISLDTELSLIREDNWDGKTRSGNNWRRTDIGINYPFSNLPSEDIERFPYAILEVKLQTQAGQDPPEWIRELTSSHLVEAVPKFSKFIHGCATLHADQIDLLPFWLPQMDIDIRKPITHRFGIERPGQSASLSTSDDSDGGDDAGFPNTSQMGLEEVRRLLPSATAGGGGNALDPEERVAPTDGAYAGSDDYYYSDSDSDSENYAARPQRRRPLGRVLKTAARRAAAVLAALVPRPRSTAMYGTNPQAGVVYARRFRAPPGKRIFVPVRVEPKVYFATERTFLSWFEFSVFLSAIAATLLNFGPDGGERGGERARAWLLWGSLGFVVTAVASLLYACGLYLWRVKAIQQRRAVSYHDRVGPSVLCGMLLAAVAVNFAAAWQGRF